MALDYRNMMQQEATLPDLFESMLNEFYSSPDYFSLTDDLSAYKILRNFVTSCQSHMKEHNVLGSFSSKAGLCIHLGNDTAYLVGPTPNAGADMESGKAIQI